ncbi:AAEL008423-PA [Aedes aegypti]|uniref:AAEL008423-PA n=1 Tax=Aedes aegypti TaxID=7159 RepID=Q16YU2_AEDAE|nr:AAEL008423-PA [Aedes aegypti]
MAYVAPNIDPYRKGQSFASWFKRLGYHFRINKVADENKKDKMFLLGGEYLFEVAQNLYLSEQLLDAAPLDELVQKLKQKLDKTDSALIHRFKFGSRIQQPGETASDFLFSLKLQAEYCNFKDDKDGRILDRVLIGLSDDALRQKLLDEDGEKLNLAQAEKMITTWEMAASHAKALTKDDISTQIASVSSLTGGRGAVLQRMANLSRGRGPVKSRLGYRSQFQSPTRSTERSTTSYNSTRSILFAVPTIEAGAVP